MGALEGTGGNSADSGEMWTWKTSISGTPGSWQSSQQGCQREPVLRVVWGREEGTTRQPRVLQRCPHPGLGVGHKNGAGGRAGRCFQSSRRRQTNSAPSAVKGNMQRALQIDLVVGYLSTKAGPDRHNSDKACN